MSRHLLGAVALIVGAFVACESPFEPRGEGERVPVGQEITDEVSGDTVGRYSFAAQGGGPYVVFLAALEGAVQLSVIDSTHQNTIATLVSGPGSPPLYENATWTFTAAPGAVYQLRLFRLPPGTHARFRFLVYPINTSPELRSDVFSFGDTVAGETIDPMVDIDYFTVHGQAGQEFVAVAETPGPPGSGSVFLNVIDPVAPDFLGYVFADAGTATPLTTGRMRLPATHDYQVILGSVTSNVYTRYRGPYRFWTYLINRAPEHRGAPIPFDTQIGSERIDRAGDVDEFTFVASPGADFNAFVQSSSRTVQLEVAPFTGPAFAAAVSQTSDTSLFSHATSRFQITQAGTYIVRVAGANPYQVADTGGYRFFLYAIDRRPEHVPQSIAPGDTVSGEDVGLPGDIDEFTFTGPAGAEFNAFLQGQNGSADAHLKVEVVNAAGTVLAIARSAGSDTNLLQQVTGRFTTPSAGTYRLRVSADDGFAQPYYRGAYRLFLYRVDRAPESVPVNLAMGDSMNGEGIDMPGDVDEYRVVVGETTGVDVVAALDAQPDAGAGVTVQLLDSTGVQVVGFGANTVRTEAGRIQVVPGVYKLRVDVTHYQDKPTFRGPYRLWLYAFSFAPELVSDTFAIGDTVSGEVIEPWGDVDRFQFYGVRGQHINVALQGRGDASGVAFGAWISGPGSEAAWTFASVTSAAFDTTLRDHQTRRLDLPVNGWYHVEMTGLGPTRGAYSMLVEALGTLPEHVPAALVPGDSVTTESIDTPGDWDEYTVTGTPGQELEVVTQGAFPYISVLDPTTRDTLASQVGVGDRVVGPFRVPAGGQVAIAVFQPGSFVRFCYDATCGGALGFVGPYRFQVVAINRGPESTPAAYAVGDTVRGEAISPVGDIDEFTSSGTPGETLTPWYHLTADPVPWGGLITLEIVDPSSGAVLVGSGAATFAANPEYFSPGSFTVPSGGGFIVRVHAYGSFGTWTATAPYEFFVRR
jgi:hypothetical protein